MLALGPLHCCCRRLSSGGGEIGASTLRKCCCRSALDADGVPTNVAQRPRRAAVPTPCVEECCLVVRYAAQLEARDCSFPLPRNWRSRPSCCLSLFPALVRARVRGGWREKIALLYILAATVARGADVNRREQARRPDPKLCFLMMARRAASPLPFVVAPACADLHCADDARARLG